MGQFNFQTSREIANESQITTCYLAPLVSPLIIALPSLKVVGSALNDTSLECTSPAVPVEGSVSVSVALRYTNTKRKAEFVVKESTGTEDGGAGENGGLGFQFYRVEAVSEIRPYEGPLRGGTAVTITGTGFRNTPELVVRFAYSGTLESKKNTAAEEIDSTSTAATVPARHISSEELMVVAPRCPLAQGAGGLFFVEVSSNGRDFTPSSDGPLFFYDASEPFVESVSPAILRESGGMVVTVRGSGFPETFPSTLTCVFGGGDDAELVPATRYSTEVLSCLSPPRRQGLVAFTLTSYGQSFSSDGDMSVEYMSDLRMFSAWPALGPASGGTAVTVLGEGFREEETYACAFGSSVQVPPVEAELVNGSAIVCRTPRVFGVDNVTLQVLTVQDDILSPSGSYVYPFVSEGLTDIAVTAATAGGTSWPPTSASLFFEYHEDIEISMASPLNGPSSGGTVVRVSGSGFLDLPEAACQFGDGELAAATVINSGTLVCTTSPLTTANISTTTARAEKGVELRVTMNGVDFSPGNTATTFLYDDDVIVSALVPDRGPATGGVRVLVRGSGFRPDEHLACRFGLQVAEAEFVRQDTIACWAPPQVRVSVVSVSVTMNGQDFSSATTTSAEYDGSGSATFTYTDRAAVTAVQPDKGPTRGGTVVAVFGVNFADSPALLCRFGNLVTSAAAFISTEEVTCVSPAVPVGAAGPVYLEVSDHGSVVTTDEASSSSEESARQLLELQEPGDDPTLWTNNRVEFVFTEDPVVLAAFPASGPSHGGTRVSLTGSGFQDLPELGCRFGGTPPLAWAEGESSDEVDVDGFLRGVTAAEMFEATGVDVAATFVSSTEVVCSAPEQSLNWTSSSATDFSAGSAGGATVRVAVTLNGQDHGLRMAQFVYYPPPKVLSISPDRGPTSGGTVVTVSGGNLTSAGAYLGFMEGSLLCRFGGPEGATVEATPVIGGSDDAVQCRSPSDPREYDGGKEVSFQYIRLDLGESCPGGISTHSSTSTMRPSSVRIDVQIT